MATRFTKQREEGGATHEHPHTYLGAKQFLGGVDIIGELRLLKLLREGPKGSADLLSIGAELLHRLQPEGGAGSWWQG